MSTIIPHDNIAVVNISSTTDVATANFEFVLNGSNVNLGIVTTLIPEVDAREFLDSNCLSYRAVVGYKQVNFIVTLEPSFDFASYLALVDQLKSLSEVYKLLV